jgi:hypothetical protein
VTYSPSPIGVELNYWFPINESCYDLIAPQFIEFLGPTLQIEFSTIKSKSDGPNHYKIIDKSDFIGKVG